MDGGRQVGPGWGWGGAREALTVLQGGVGESFQQQGAREGQDDGVPCPASPVLPVQGRGRQGQGTQLLVRAARVLGDPWQAWVLP